jgi:hypothetical protein
MKQLVLIIAIVLLPVLSQAQPAEWAINSSGYEFSMTLTAEVKLEGTSYNEEGNYLAAFIDGECRGVAEASYVEAYDKYLYFLTVFSNTYSGEEVVFKCFDASAEYTLEGFNPAGFFDGHNVGTAESPVEISEEVFVGIDDPSSASETAIEVYPNPAVDLVTIEAVNLEKVLLMDMTGRVIESRESDNSKAEFSVSSLPKGLYFLNIKTVGGEEKYKKLIVQ